MTTIIELEDIDIQSLSGETQDLISELTAEIAKLDGSSFNFNDPFLLPKIRRHVKRLKNRPLKALYRRFTQALRHSAKQGKFGIRPYRISITNRRRFPSTRSLAQAMV